MFIKKWKNEWISLCDLQQSLKAWYVEANLINKIINKNFGKTKPKQDIKYKVVICPLIEINKSTISSSMTDDQISSLKVFNLNYVAIFPRTFVINTEKK